LKRKVVYGLNINKTGDEYVRYYMFVFYVVIIVVWRPHVRHCQSRLLFGSGAIYLLELFLW